MGLIGTLEHYVHIFVLFKNLGWLVMTLRNDGIDFQYLQED